MIRAMRPPLPALGLLAALLSPSVADAQEVLGADVSSTTRANPDSAAAGEEITLILGASNAGPEQANDVTITAELPQGLMAGSVVESPGPCSLESGIVCRVGALPPGASAQVRILAAVTREGSQVVRAGVAARQNDPVPENNASTAELSANGPSCGRVGTFEPDILKAGRAGSVLCGFSGDDTLLGGPRGDTLLGGGGRDSLVGDAGHDELDGGEETDACAGDPGAGRRSGCELDVFALAGQLPLVELGPSTVGYGYHQSLFATAMGLRAFGDHVVMSSRNRGTGSTTAADIVVGNRSRVRAPVTGEVVAVKRYLLYCERPDWKVVIRPAADPSLRVLVLHLGRPGVRDGDQVTAGISRMGRARPADWPDSQKDRYFPARYPHVHVEVERNGASPTPGCAI
jgi:uncharacterized repeat protein (TIGR01451 family)